MERSSAWRWTALIVANVLAWCVLGLYRPTTAAPQVPQRGQLPFRNSVEQRNEMIRELRHISGLLQEQNELLRAAGHQERHER